MILAHGFLLLSFLGAVFVGISAEKLIPFNDGNIQYVGRWRISSTDIQSGWPGAYFRTRVAGTHVSLRLNSATSVYVKIDDRPTVQLDAPYQGTLPIKLDVANDLADGPHDIIVVSSANTSICLESIVLSEEGQIAPTIPLPNMIEFIGHDLILGTHTSKQLLSSFSWLVADMLSAERAQIAFRNAWLMDHDDGQGMESRYFSWNPTSDVKWDFSTYVPAGIVILLGRNDHQESYGDHLVNFLKRARSHAASAAMLVLSEPLGDRLRESQEAVVQLNDLGDQDIYFIDTTGWIRPRTVSTTTEQLHGEPLNDTEHELFARKLAPLLQAKLSVPRRSLPGPPPNPNLPNNWRTMDVGDDASVGLPGSVSFDSGNTFTLWGSGVDIGNVKDAFRYVYQQLSGDGAIEVTVDSHSAFATCAKAGIMMREHLAPGSPNVMLGVSPAHGLFLHTRTDNFNTTQLVKKSRASPPYRLRLTRKGNEFTAQTMRPTEQTMAWETFRTISKTVLARDIYVGIAVTSCDPSVVSVGKFTNVTLQGGVGSGSYGYSSLLRLTLQKPIG
ncbi:hypothetical protein DFQ28_009006 [Apophysomyces sp. BC1034]|nr:hypothetical protein DFQ30_008636 [Apophysomyces sp. BC1015]KAG0174021.1 hypothetical protein DFQ29_007647 [Apophysomyces sp. BC1021]KAG0185676.1 hypothetical protein DFQ28_009006 [Apophysomyces sp. BC1034]